MQYDLMIRNTDVDFDCSNLFWTKRPFKANWSTEVRCLFMSFVFRACWADTVYAFSWFATFVIAQVVFYCNPNEDSLRFNEAASGSSAPFAVRPGG